jgi:hypothetical protein
VREREKGSLMEDCGRCVRRLLQLRRVRWTLEGHWEGILIHVTVFCSAARQIYYCWKKEGERS